MRLRTTLLATCAVALLSTAAQAQVQQGFYIGGATGLNLLQDIDGELGIVGSPQRLDLDLDSRLGWALVGQVGYALGNGMRFEVEPGFRHNSVEGGRVRTYSLMANALYDFNTGTAFTPYVGVGVGVARVGLDVSGAAGATRGEIDGPDNAFAYQGILGVGYALTRNLTLDLSYRYFGTAGTDHEGDAVVGGTRVGLDYDTDRLHNHTLMVGVRYAFGGPAAPPPAPVAAPAAAPAPAPAPAVRQAQTYLVFFDFDSAELTPAARDTIATAANTVRSGGVARIEVVGHTDTAGSPQYNQRLGQRRADAVRTEMVRRGVAQNTITTRSAGESQLRVPTADGVREAQNRRAEIVLPPT
ncbi:MAG TPA: outer membrane beta-barrel protein [Azospirillaceae bacterium]|nr:outer membrane beta-barrel protein [Azospirillaceae bacterium]